MLIKKHCFMGKNSLPFLELRVILSINKTGKQFGKYLHSDTYSGCVCSQIPGEGDFRYLENELYKYITGIVQSYNHKVLAINGVEDHVHLFFGMRPTQSLSDLMKAVKENSSLWINKQGLVKNKFNWQGGYGAFAYSKSSVKM